MTCPQLAAFLPRKFPIQVTRGALNMAFLDMKGQHIDAVQRGSEIAYSLMPFWREYILGVAQEIQKQAKNTEVKDEENADSPA